MVMRGSPCGREMPEFAGMTMRRREKAPDDPSLRWLDGRWERNEMGQPHAWLARVRGFRGRFDRQAMLSMLTLPRLTHCRSPSRGRSITATLTQIY